MNAVAEVVVSGRCTCEGESMGGDGAASRPPATGARHNKSIRHPPHVPRLLRYMKKPPIMATSTTTPPAIMAMSTMPDSPPPLLPPPAAPPATGELAPVQRGGGGVRGRPGPNMRAAGRVGCPRPRACSRCGGCVQARTCVSACKRRCACAARGGALTGWRWGCFRGRERPRAPPPAAGPRSWGNPGSGDQGC
jgi:hypothetical protein